MTAPGGKRPSMMETVQTTAGFLRHAGRDFLVVLYTAFRSLKLYPIENAQVQKALDDLAATTKQLLDVERELEVRLQGEFIFVNSTRLRLDLDNYASFSHILNVLQQCGIGAVRIDEGVDRKQLQIFVSLMLSYAAKEANPNKLFELSQKLVDGGVSFITVEPPLEQEEDVEEEERQKEAAKRTYARSVAVTKEVINSIRMGRTANVKKVKRAVQAIVDQVLNNESSLVGLTTLRDYDEYTFTHSVNVCIFSVALGRKLGLTKLQLYDLGMAALFHDVGKSRVPLGGAVPAGIALRRSLLGLEVEAVAHVVVGPGTVEAADLLKGLEVDDPEPAVLALGDVLAAERIGQVGLPGEDVAVTVVVDLAAAQPGEVRDRGDVVGPGHVGGRACWVCGLIGRLVGHRVVAAEQRQPAEDGDEADGEHAVGRSGEHGTSPGPGAGWLRRSRAGVSEVLS